MKKNAGPRQCRIDGAERDAAVLQKRAAEDAVKDANLYAIRIRWQYEKAVAANSLGRSAHLLSRKSTPKRVDPLEEIDGVLIHPVEGKNSLVLSDELLEISLPAEVEALAAEPVRIFHVQSPAPWVQQVRPGAA